MYLLNLLNVYGDNMKARILFEEFLNRCKEYEEQYDRVIFKDNDNICSVFKPNESKQQEFILYECSFNGSREQGLVFDIDELIEIVINTVGNDKLKELEEGKIICKKLYDLYGW